VILVRAAGPQADLESMPHVYCCRCSVSWLASDRNISKKLQVL